MGQSSQALGDRPEVTQAQRIHGQAAERGQDPHAIGLSVTVIVFPELRVAGPVPGGPRPFARCKSRGPIALIRE